MELLELAVASAEDSISQQNLVIDIPVSEMPTYSLLSCAVITILNTDIKTEIVVL